MTQLLDTFCNVTLTENLNVSFSVEYPRCNANLQFDPCEGTEFLVLRESQYASAVQVPVSACIIPLLDHCTLGAVLYDYQIYPGISAYTRTMTKQISGAPPLFEITDFRVTDNSNPTRVEVTLDLTVNAANLPCIGAFPDQFAVTVPETFTLLSQVNSTCGNYLSASYSGGLERSFQVNSTAFQVTLVSEDNLFASGNYTALVVGGTGSPTTLYPTRTPTEPPIRLRPGVATEHLLLLMVLPVLLSLVALFVVNYSV